MVNLDLSKGVHPRFLDLFPAFMPGLFFEISILFARPQQVQEFVVSAHLERYLQVLIALILAFVIGNAFVFWVRLIYVVLWVAVRAIFRLWVKLLDYLMNSKKFPPPLPPAQPSRWRKFVLAAHTKAKFTTPEVHGIQQAWAKAAVQVLKLRYGIDPPPPIGSEFEWGAWQTVLGLPKPKLYRGLMLISASQATGWSGVVAAYLSPALRNSPYLAFSLFLIVHGFITQLFELKRWMSRKSVWTIRLYSLLDEIPQANTEAGKQKDQEQGDDILGAAEGS